MPILKAPAGMISKLRLSLYNSEYSDLTVADFSDTAQSCKTYDEYIDKISAAEDIRYLSLALCGAKKKINNFTGNLPLLK